MLGTDDDMRLDIGVGTVKRAHRDQRKAEKRVSRKKWWRELRCFWTPPFRHEWVTEQNEYDSQRYRRCVGCGKQHETA